MEPMELADGGFSGDPKGTSVFHATNRTYLCASRNHYQALATTASAMADGGEVESWWRWIR